MVDMAMEDMVAMGATGMERDLLKLKLMLNQDIPEDMEVMVAMDVATTERGRLMLNQATTEVMDMVVMVATDVATMERGRLTLNQATMVATDMEAMVATDVATTERGRLMLWLSQDTTPEVMDMEVMVAMDVA